MRERIYAVGLRRVCLARFALSQQFIHHSSQNEFQQFSYTRCSALAVSIDSDYHCFVGGLLAKWSVTRIELGLP